MTSSDQDKCSLTSFLSMSCRGRAEAFARSLHSKLRSLGSQDDHQVDESSWLAGGHETNNAISVTQPRANENDLYFDLELESPGSPGEELEPVELDKLLNTDGLTSVDKSCHCNQILEETDEEKEHLLGKECSCSNKKYEGINNGEVKLEENSECSCCRKEEKSHLNGEIDEERLNRLDVEKLEEHEGDCNCFDIKDKTERRRCYLVENGKNDSDSSDGQFYDTENDLESVISDEKSSQETDEIQQESNEVEQNDISASPVQNSEESPFSSLVTITCESVDTSDTTDTFTTSSDSNDLINEVENSLNNLKLEIIDEKIEDHKKLQEDDDVESDERTPRVRRCSSLKTGKTPPGTPGSKKIVRFADVLGLDLADVRTFLDEIPKIPTSAYDDLTDVDLDESDSAASSQDYQISNHGIKVDRVLVPLFQQPGGQTDFLDKVRDRNVVLENAMVQDPVALTIVGNVRVRNLDFHKSVFIRYSLDLWQTFADIQATYIENTCDGFSDKFSFTLNGNNLTFGKRVEFAVRFQCKGAQYWDNNNGVNYCFQCLPSSSYSPANSSEHPRMVTDDCGASFYYNKSSSVQDYVFEKMLQKSSTTCPQRKRNSYDILSIVIIVFASILFLYMQLFIS